MLSKAKEEEEEAGQRREKKGLWPHFHVEGPAPLCTRPHSQLKSLWWLAPPSVLSHGGGPAPTFTKGQKKQGQKIFPSPH